MSQPVRWVPDDAAIREWLRTSPELRTVLMHAAGEAAGYARSIAPVRTGSYRDSIVAEFHVSRTRMSYRVVAYDHKAHWVEAGSAHNKPFRVLGKAMARVRV